MKILSAVLFSLGLTACASTGVEQYKAEQPALDLKHYLNGTLDAWGMFQGRSGEVKKVFTSSSTPAGTATPAFSTSSSNGRTEALPAVSGP